MPTPRRPCKACGRGRAEKFYSSPRAKTCSDCLKQNRRSYSREKRLAQVYGLSLEDYRILLDLQGGVCAICKGERPYNLDIDHDHADDRIRGLLCKQCNRYLLPAARDRIAVFEGAIEYLRNPPAQTLWHGRKAPPQVTGEAEL